MFYFYNEAKWHRRRLSLQKAGVGISNGTSWQRRQCTITGDKFWAWPTWATAWAIVAVYDAVIIICNHLSLGLSWLWSWATTWREAPLDDGRLPPPLCGGCQRREKWRPFLMWPLAVALLNGGKSICNVLIAAQIEPRGNFICPRPRPRPVCVLRAILGGHKATWSANVPGQSPANCASLVCSWASPVQSSPRSCH